MTLWLHGYLYEIFFARFFNVLAHCTVGPRIENMKLVQSLVIVRLSFVLFHITYKSLENKNNHYSRIQCKNQYLIHHFFLRENIIMKTWQQKKISFQNNQKYIPILHICAKKRTLRMGWGIVP